MCLAQGPQRCDASEARTRGPSVSSQALYHWATALPRGNFGTGVRTSILKPTPIIYLAFEKKQPIHILDFTKSWLSQVWYLIVSIPDLCTLTYFYSFTVLWINIPFHAKNMCIYMGVRKFGPFIYQHQKIALFIYILFKKRGLSYTWQPWKGGYSARTSVLCHVKVVIPPSEGAYCIWE